MKKLFSFSALMDSISMSSNKKSAMTKNNSIQESVITIKKNSKVVDIASAKKDNMTQPHNLPPLTKVQWEYWLQDNLLKIKIASVQLNFISDLNSSSVNN